MRKNAAVLTVVCLLLCLSFNYTFPLHRDSKKSSGFGNQTQRCANENNEHGGSIGDQTKMGTNIEHPLQKVINQTPGKNKAKKETKCSHTKQAALDNDLSNYEQLVIMKKYPFLDLQELEFNYHPLPNKNTRQSLNSAPNLAEDPSFCEPLDEVPNVEITNRGLTGFAIPPKLLKPASTAGNTINLQKANAVKSQPKKSLVSQRLDDLRLLESLEEEIKQFEKHLG